MMHKYYRSVLGTFFICVIGFSMLFFGVDFGGGRSGESYAVKVNDTEVSFEQFSQRKQLRTNQLLRMLGPNYQQFAAQLLEGMNQRIIDDIIKETLLQETAREVGMAPGEAVVPKLVYNAFGPNFTMESYRAFLRSIGSTEKEYHAQVASQTLGSQVQNLLRQASYSPPPLVIKGLYEQQERKYSARIIGLTEAAAKERVEEPSEEKLKEFFEENVIEYELPPRIRATYIVAKTDHFLNEVEVLDEDVELYYVDNEKRFRNPAGVKIREIALDMDSADMTAKIGVESLADELFEKVEKGEDLKSLAVEYSDDTKKGDPSGWIEKGSQGAQFDKEFFGEDVKVGKRALIKDGSKARIVELIEQQEISIKPLDEVREEIIKSLKDRDAPIFAAEKARELFDKWQTEGSKLEDLSKEYGIEVSAIAELTGLENASGIQRPIVKDALEFPGETQLLVDTGEALALVRVDEFRDTEVPDFASVREKALDDYKSEQAKTLARDLSDKLLTDLESGELTDEALKERGATVELVSEKRSEEFNTVPLSSTEVRQAVLGTDSPRIVSGSPFEVNNAFYIIQITEVKDPDPANFQERSATIKKQSAEQLALLLEESLVSKLKAETDIDVHPATFEQ
ncbi:MAG: SurA N-terminal domain-containing protein [Bdellovibrionales bacterium]|nr:SurA N-terminal domain-containing protein [Bdellovibrionales bacterium]